MAPSPCLSPRKPKFEVLGEAPPHPFWGELGSRRRSTPSLSFPNWSSGQCPCPPGEARGQHSGCGDSGGGRREAARVCTDARPECGGTGPAESGSRRDRSRGASHRLRLGSGLRAGVEVPARPLGGRLDFGAPALGAQSTSGDGDSFRTEGAQACPRPGEPPVPPPFPVMPLCPHLLQGPHFPVCSPFSASFF